MSKLFDEWDVRTHQNAHSVRYRRFVAIVIKSKEFSQYPRRRLNAEGRVDLHWINFLHMNCATFAADVVDHCVCYPRYLAAAKARGVKLGNPNGARALRGKQTGNAETVARIKEKAAQRAIDLQGIVEGIRRSGVTSIRGITEELNRQGIAAPRGDTWHPTAVARLINRLSTV